MKLTKDEKKFLLALNSRGSMSLNEVRCFWATPSYIKPKLMRLKALGLINITECDSVVSLVKYETLLSYM